MGCGKTGRTDRNALRESARSAPLPVFHPQVRKMADEKQTPFRVNPMTPTEAGPVYPGGENAKSYAFVFQVWMVLFLIVVCFGLLNFIASQWRAWFPR
jgi:hypothetical protein